MDPNVFKDSITRIMELVKATFGENGELFNQYYEGDPIIIPKANLPCVIIEKLSGNATVRGAPTGHDNVGEKIQIRLCLNKKEDFNATDDYDLTERRLRQMIEARDSVTGQFKANTLMYVLRTNITLGNSVLDQDFDVEYDVNPRPNQEVTSEGIITIVTREIVQVPNRV